MLDFCKKVKSRGKISLLVPSKKLAGNLRDKLIKRLVTFVGREAKFQSHFTLDDLLQFLIIYSEATFEVKQKDEHDPRVIKILPILIEIAT